MTRTTKLFLFALDMFFLIAPKKTCRQLMEVLTALRGPDSGNYHLKCDTTARIRGRVFWHSGKRMREHTDYSITLRPTSVYTRYSDNDSAHFLGHVRSAAELLGLWVF